MSLLGLGAAGVLLAWWVARSTTLPPILPSSASPADSSSSPMRTTASPDAARSGVRAETSRTPPLGPTSDVGAEPLPAAAADVEPEELGERRLYERFVAAEAEQPGTLAARAEDVLLGAGPDPQKVALLRAVRDLDVEGARELWLLALQELPDVSDARGESVPSTVLLLLDRNAARDARARDTLREAAFDVPELAPELRGRAATSFFRYARPDELLAARAVLSREREPLVLTSALDALSRNPHGDVASTVAGDHAAAAPSRPESPNETR